MMKCLECINFVKNGKICKCKACPGTVYFGDGYPSEPLVESCGSFKKDNRNRGRTASNYRRK